MPKYNLDALGHEEFERLCQSLVQQIIGPGAKVYGMGSDGAREATFHGKAPYPSKEEQWDGSWIFQAKFHDIQQIGPREARRRLIAEIEDELSKITEKYQHPCDNFILMTNVSLTPVFQKGIKDIIDNEIIPNHRHSINHIHVWGAEEICRFLDAYPNIRQTYAHLLVSGDIIGRLLGLMEGEKTDIDELVKLYCEGCFNYERSAALDDAGDVEDKPVALQQVFVDLDVKPPTLPRDLQMLETLPAWLKQSAEDEQRTSALSYLLDDCVRGLVFIGGPGEGKSTLGQYIAQFHRARIISKLNELGKEAEKFENSIPRVPFRILLREYAQWIASRSNSDSLFHYLAAQISRDSGRTVNPEDIHKIVKANQVLLILDGLDEVSEKRLRTRVLQNISSFVNQVRDVLKGDLRVVATTRPYGYSEEFDPTHYLHLTLEKLSPEKAVLYARQWTDAREPNPREGERILNALGICFNDKVVSVLTQTPLQVTILLVIIRARGTPPKQREELFERYMDIIYQREQKRRPELLRTEQNIIYGLHKYLAYVLHRRAEKDKTASLMDAYEFKKGVEEYLFHCNPLLKGKELETQVQQIITEASQRLVLIESPQEGKVGFGLATTREFFAAAHLVDTAKDTKERDLRFKAISRSPHWRNVALFFAGRVGRTRPGEASSMIDVCREMDTEKADKFLKRGAELVTEMVDDRVLREPHNEIGAIQYGLTLLDRDFIKNREDFVKKLSGFSEQYKELVIRPWFEERLNTVAPENLALYADIYEKLFGVSELWLATLKRASDSGSKEVKLWVLSQAFKNKIAEKWIMKLFEELVSVIPTNKLVLTISDHWTNLGFFLGFPLSQKVRVIIASALIDGFERARLHRPKPHEELDELSGIKAVHKREENFLYLEAVSQLLIISRLSAKEETWRKRELALEFDLPGFALPHVKETINKNAMLFENFCATFSGEDESFTSFLVALFSFLIEPHNLDKYIALSKKSQEPKTDTQWFTGIVRSILGLTYEDEEKLFECHQNLVRLHQIYKSEKLCKTDIEELLELVNRRSKNIRNHPLKLLVWADCHCDPKIEKFLDSEIVSELRRWLQHRGLSESVLSLLTWRIRPLSVWAGSMIYWSSKARSSTTTLEFFKFTLEAMGIQLKDKKPIKPWPLSLVSDYEWHEPKTKEELLVANRLKGILEEVLTHYSFLKDPGHFQLEPLYWSALNAGVIEEQHMIQLYTVFRDHQNLPSRYWYASYKNAKPSLAKMLKSEKLEIAHLAAASISAIQDIPFISSEHRRIEETSIGDKFRDFAKNKEDIWRFRYIRGMSYCRLNWADNWEEWLEAIKGADTEELRDAWCQVIKEGGYYEEKDRNALFNLLLHILESGKTFAKPIQLAALQRLSGVISEIEPLGFDEEEFNLPLSRRAGFTSS